MKRQKTYIYILSLFFMIIISIQCKSSKSIEYNTKKEGFLDDHTFQIMAIGVPARNTRNKKLREKSAIESAKIMAQKTFIEKVKGARSQGVSGAADGELTGIAITKEMGYSPTLSRQESGKVYPSRQNKTEKTKTKVEEKNKNDRNKKWKPRSVADALLHGTVVSKNCDAEQTCEIVYRIEYPNLKKFVLFGTDPNSYNMHPVHNTEQYASIIENDFLSVKEAPLSTFSIDVDTASYSNVRRFINNGQLPPNGTVRIEEMINYFSYKYPQTKNNHPVLLHSELSECPWNTNNKLVLLALQGKNIDQTKIPIRNLVFLLDVSGSMFSDNKLPLLKKSLRLLVEQLTANDRVAIVVYAGAAGMVLPPTPGNQKIKILAALEKLQAGGSTNGGEGIELAYLLAQKSFKKNGINRVIIGTDGDFNVGNTSEDSLEKLVEKKRKTGIFLTVLGFGMSNYKDKTMEMLADKGNGNYAYIDNLNEARKVLVQEINSTLITRAKDVKIQVEFNPRFVKAYRLLGYENRKLKDQDFSDDTKDAGEIGAGQSMTALYEIVPANDSRDFTKVETLRYQTQRSSTDHAQTDEVLLFKVRYKQPDKNTSVRIEKPVKNLFVPIARSSENLRWAASVASFAMVLRNSKYKGDADFNMSYQLARKAMGNDAHGYRAEFLNLLRKAQSLKK